MAKYLQLMLLKTHAVIILVINGSNPMLLNPMHILSSGLFNLHANGQGLSQKVTAAAHIQKLEQKECARCHVGVR